MSIMSSSCFLLFLLCLSLHACSARRLGAVVVDHSKNKLEKKLHNFSIKNDNMKNIVVQQVMKSTSSLSKELGSDRANDHDETVENKKEKTSSSSSSSSGAVMVGTNKSSVVSSSVSWRVPHRKRGEKHPGFNLDYSPPKTHPPSHN